MDQFFSRDEKFDEQRDDATGSAARRPQQARTMCPAQLSLSLNVGISSVGFTLQLPYPMSQLGCYVNLRVAAGRARGLTPRRGTNTAGSPVSIRDAPDAIFPDMGVLQFSFSPNSTRSLCTSSDGRYEPAKFPLLRIRPLQLQ
jgi:hypothetical protein